MNRSFKKNLVFGTLLLGATTIHAQVVKHKVGDNPTIISASTVLEVESTNKGVLLPRIGLASATDATTIPSPATSLLIYNTATAGTSPNDVAPGFYYWSGTRWNKLSVGSETDPVIGNEILDAVANGGLTRTGTGTAADPYKIKITDGTTNGQVLTWDGTKWTAAAAGAEVDGIIGNEVLNATTNKGLTRAGAGTNADPYTLGLTDGTAANQTMVWNGTTWAPATTPEVDGIIGNEVVTATTNRGLERAGTGTNADPYTLGLTAGTTTGQVYKWDGTNWVPGTDAGLTAEVDGIIGNEVTDAVANGGLTRTGTGTAADPYKLKINDGSTNGQVLTWDGAKWVAAAAGAEVDGIIGNEVLNATTNKGLTRAGAGTNADPYTLGLTDGTAANQTMVWNGTTWAPATTPEVDGIIGNEVTDAVVDGGLTRTGTGTAADPYKLKINDGTTNGQVLTWDGAKWTATAAGAEVDGIIGNEVVTATTNRGLVRAGTGTNADPYTLGLTAGTTTGQVYKWDGTNWVPGTDAGLTAEVDGIIGNEVTDVVANKGLTRTGTGTTADPYKVQMTDGTAANQTMVWNGTTWAPATTPEVDGIIGNEVLNATTNKGLTRAGAGTNADPYTLGLTDGTAANQTMVWNGTTWAPATTPEVDGIIGNEVTDAVVDGGLTRTGTGTAADPYKLKINDGSTNGQVLTWDGTKWVAAAASSDWKLLGNAGTTAGTNFIGTTDAIDFVTKTNNAEVMRATSAGNVGVGTATPTSKLQVSGSFALPLLNTAAAITLDATHATVRIDATTANVNVTLPAANTATGRIYKVIKADSTTNKLIFSATVLGNGFTFTEANVPGEYKIQSNGTNWYLLD